MIESRRNGWRVALVLLALAASLSAARSADAEPPLTQEEVVRRFAAGASEDELLRMIRTREAAFDLSEEMLHELRNAGLPESVLLAMRRRQDEAIRRRAEEADRLPADGAPLRVLLGSGPSSSKQRTIRIYDEVHPDLALVWKLGNAPEERRFTDIAVFLACRTPEHVPDGWREKTPLEWSAEPMLRHQMLAFAPGAQTDPDVFLARFGFRPSLGPRTAEGDGLLATTPVEPRGRRVGTLTYELPQALEVELTPGVAHDLSIGVALRVGDTYYPWAVSALDGVVLEESGLDLEARVRRPRQRDLGSLDIDFVEADARSASPRKLVASGCPKRP
jgi:hypothetical protein